MFPHLKGRQNKINDSLPLYLIKSRSTIILFIFDYLSIFIEPRQTFFRY